MRFFLRFFLRQAFRAAVWLVVVALENMPRRRRSMKSTRMTGIAVFIAIAGIGCGAQPEDDALSPTNQPLIGGNPTPTARPEVVRGSFSAGGCTATMLSPT